MSSETHTLFVEADATKANAVFDGLDAAVEASAKGAKRLAANLSKAEAETEKISEETRRLVDLRKAEAQELEHQAAVMRTLGDAQEDIDEAIRQSLALRREAAVLSGRHADIVRAAQAEELNAARSIAAEQRRADEARIAAARELAAAQDAQHATHIAKLKEEWAIQERALQDTLAAERQRAELLAREAEELDHQAALLQAQGRDVQRSARLREAALNKQIDAARQLGDLDRARGLEREKELRDAQQLAEQRERAADATKTWRDRVKDLSGSWLEVGSSVGNILSGIQSAIAMGREAVAFVDETVNESFEVQAIARNLQLDISQARDALGGMVADKDLALAANKAVAMGVADTGAQFAHIAEMVAQQALKLGKDQTQLINDYVEAVGKQEAEIFDNLGLTLRLSDAYDIQAEKLGKAASELTKSEKATAFQTAALLELERATGQSAVQVDGFARSWKEGRVEWENFRSSVLGFDDTAGKVSETLRNLGDEELDKFERLARDMKFHGASVDELDERLTEYGISLAQVQEIAEERGQTVAQLLQQEIAAHEAKAAKLEAERIEEEKLATVRQMSTEADDIAHTAQLLGVMGASKRDVLETEIQSLELQRDALLLQAEITRSAEDEAKARKLTQQIELKQAAIENIGRSRGGRRRDPNAAINRTRDALIAELDAREKLITAQDNQRRGAEERAAIELHLISLARQELDVRQQAEEARDPKKVEDVAKRDLELQKIATERRILDLETQQAIVSAEREIADQRLAAMDREIERNEALGVAVQLLQQRRREAAVAYAEEFGAQEEILQARHEAELAQIEEDRARRVAIEQERLTAFEREMELADARGQLIDDEEQRRLEFEDRIAEAEGNSERRREIAHKREVARLAQRTKKQQQAVQAANGFLGQASQFGTLVVDQAIKDDERREKAALRLNGIMALARAALETVEAVAAFARYDFVGGALHVAAAAVATATGISLLAGNVQGAGAGGAGAGASAAGPGTGGSTVPGAGAGSSSSRETPVVPPNAEELTRIRGGLRPRDQDQGQSGGTVVNISHSTIVSGDDGTMLNDLTSRRTRKKYGT